jgi:hypothetical protein
MKYNIIGKIEKRSKNKILFIGKNCITLVRVSVTPK